MMNTLARSVLTLFSYDDKADDISIENVLRQSLMLIAVFPLLSVYGYQAYNHYVNKDSFYIHPPQPELSTAENILYTLRKDSKYTQLEARILDVALILHAEHGGGNNSTFTTHTGNTTVHITSTERTNWNSAYTLTNAATTSNTASTLVKRDTDGSIDVGPIITTGSIRANCNAQAITANGTDHVYYAWSINDTRKAYAGFGSAGTTEFTICNEAGGDITLSPCSGKDVRINGDIVMVTSSSTVDGRDVSADGTKLDVLETIRSKRGRKPIILGTDIVQDTATTMTTLGLTGITWGATNIVLVNVEGNLQVQDVDTNNQFDYSISAPETITFHYDIPAGTILEVIVL
jgi:hypothetical protein